MRLVGHADPRGEDSYNLALGERRANGVKKYLTNAGLNGDQGELTSRGEMDATGADEEGWKKDRRVDIVLAD
jgi:peptidoglycan-associated lipoprotein